MRLRKVKPRRSVRKNDFRVEGEAVQRQAGEYLVATRGG